MTTITTQASDDDFNRIEQNIDWIEQLESIRSRRDKEAATRETIEYVARLRAAIAALVSGMTDDDATDPWAEYFLPAWYSQHALV